MNTLKFFLLVAGCIGVIFLIISVILYIVAATKAKANFSITIKGEPEGESGGLNGKSR